MATFYCVRGDKMKTLLIICALVMVFSVALVQAQPSYQLSTPAGGAKNFTTFESVAPNASISFDIYLTSCRCSRRIPVVPG